MADRKLFEVEKVFRFVEFYCGQMIQITDRKVIKLKYKCFFITLLETEWGEVEVSVLTDPSSHLTKQDCFPLIWFNVSVDVYKKEDPVYVGDIEVSATALSERGIDRVTQSLRDLSDFRVALIDLVAHRHEYLDLPLTE